MKKKIVDVYNSSCCPKCGAKWREDDTFSRIIGIEIPGKYDGVSYWQCPDCQATWDRFTKKEVSPEVLNHV